MSEEENSNAPSTKRRAHTDKVLFSTESLVFQDKSELPSKDCSKQNRANLVIFAADIALIDTAGGHQRTRKLYCPEGDF
jgi:hypothetical protein